MSRRFVLILSTILLVAHLATAQKSITAGEAKSHIGEQQTVGGKVVSTRFAENSRGKPTFLNLDRAYPDQIFTVVTWGSDRSKFGDPETSYRGHQICVTGRISDYRGVPEIVAQAPSQINEKYHKTESDSDIARFVPLDAGELSEQNPEATKCFSMICFRRENR